MDKFKFFTISAFVSLLVLINAIVFFIVGNDYPYKEHYDRCGELDYRVHNTTNSFVITYTIFSPKYNMYSQMVMDGSYYSYEEAVMYSEYYKYYSSEIVCCINDGVLKDTCERTTYTATGYFLTSLALVILPFLSVVTWNIYSGKWTQSKLIKLPLVQEQDSEMASLIPPDDSEKDVELQDVL
jgi:hypothetical protein